MFNEDVLKRMHWEEGLTLDEIGKRINYSLEHTRRFFVKYGIPTSGSLVRCFGDYKKSPDLDYYLRWYMENHNRYSMANNGHPKWRAKSVSRPNITRLARYLKKKTDITYSIYDPSDGHVLETTGFKNCMALSSYFDLSWYEELLRLLKKFPNSPELRQGEALDFLLSFMINGEWVDLPYLSSLLNWTSNRTSQVLYTAMNKNLIERAGERGSYKYRVIGKM